MSSPTAQSRVCWSARGQAVVILLLSLLVGTALNHWRPQPLPWRQDWSQQVQQAAATSGVAVVTLAEAKALVDARRHIIIDARPEADYNVGHLPGAFPVPSQAIGTYLPQVLPLLTPGQPILTYCSGHQCDESLLVSRHLLQNGFTNVVLFSGGWSEWSAAGYPVER